MIKKPFKRYQINIRLSQKRFLLYILLLEIYRNWNLFMFGL